MLITTFRSERIADLQANHPPGLSPAESRAGSLLREPSSLCLFGKSSGFCAVTMLLCSHQTLIHSLCLLCGHHAVEAAQGKVGPSPSRRNEGLGVGSRQWEVRKCLPGRVKFLV
jgi:hypothetical protein